MNMLTAGIDLAKNVFVLHGIDQSVLEFFATHAQTPSWSMPNPVKSPKTQDLPDIVTVDEA